MSARKKKTFVVPQPQARICGRCGDPFETVNDASLCMDCRAPRHVYLRWNDPPKQVVEDHEEGSWREPR